MEKLVIRGGRPLEGSLAISASKNAAVAADGGVSVGPWGHAFGQYSTTA